MRILLVSFCIRFFTCLSGDIQNARIDFQNQKPEKIIAIVLNKDIIKEENKSAELTPIVDENKSCGDMPGQCGESMIDYDIQTSKKIKALYLLTSYIIIVLIVCITAQICTFAILLRLMMTSKRRIQYHIGGQGRSARESSANRSIAQNEAEPLQHNI